jgi:hypothetical protein
MNTLGGAVITVLALLAWGGQTIAWLAPEVAVRWGLMEAEADVEPTYWADIRGEAAWDTVSLWTLVAAGVLLIIDQPAWAYFGLVGGGMFLYFAGRGILTRVAMRRRGLRIGSPKSVRTGLIALAVWGGTALATVFAAVRALPT